MTKKYSLSLFIFRRDLRIYDNTALNEALKLSKAVIPCFIFDPIQIGPKNQFKSANAIQFMIESLIDLQTQIKPGKLFVFKGPTQKIVAQLLDALSIDAVFINKDYTPFSKTRDKALEDLCTKKNCDFISLDDALLTHPQEIKTKASSYYTVFTPFLRRTLQEPIRAPFTPRAKHFYTKTIAGLEIIDLKKECTPKGVIQKNSNPLLAVHGGRSEGLAILKKINTFKNYAKTRDFPDIPTTHLSAHNKFGTLSIREVASAIISKLEADHPLVRQLYWRDFYTYVLDHAPEALTSAAQPKYRKIKWPDNAHFFKAWSTGMTGFPIVDAGIRELVTTGFMHNRVRMIVASFLTKDLLTNWQKGEQFFAQHLIDYDPAVNNGNWQWCASVGYDAQPYFRIFNPWTQQKRFDPECLYIKKWVPEVRSYSPKIIHAIEKQSVPGYPKPIVNHADLYKKILNFYKKYSR